MKYVLAVQDLQFGSTGKGQVAGSLAHVWYPDTVVTAWGPNAGHTFRRDGKKWVHTMLATSAICPSVEQILIGPGSVINLDNLVAEINGARQYLRGKRLVAHPQATVVQEAHRGIEAQELLRIGSTMKGTGAAMCDKIMRKTVTVRSNTDEVIAKLGRACMEADMAFSMSSHIYDQCVDMSEKMIVEGAQGFSLGVHTDFYPCTTSRDISTAQLIADCRLPFPDKGFKVVGVCRTYPIRVANRPVPGDTSEEPRFYSSGGHYDDQEELNWTGDLGRPPEMTTVTKLPRRVFSFSHSQVIEACRIMRPDFIALTFCDYLLDEDKVWEKVETDTPTALPVEVGKMIFNIEGGTGVPVRMMSFGPESADVYERVLDTSYVRPLDGAFLVGGPDESADTQ